MKTTNINPRRAFISTTFKTALLIGAGSGIAGSILNPVAIMAQNTDSALQSKIALLGTVSLQTSRLALSKASNAEVKMFAKFEAAEQEAMGKILKDLGTMTPALNEEIKVLINKLESLNGVAFDKAYMQAQVDTHQKLKNAVSALLTASSNKHVKNVTSLALATIQEHTERAQLILGKI